MGEAQEPNDRPDDLIIGHVPFRGLARHGPRVEADPDDDRGAGRKDSLGLPRTTLPAPRQGQARDSRGRSSRWLSRQADGGRAAS